jgi:hypothetical protein
MIDRRDREKDPSPQDWADLRDYCRRIDRMLKAHERQRDIDSTPTWALAAILLTMGAGLFIAGVLLGHWVW